MLSPCGSTLRTTTVISGRNFITSWVSKVLFLTTNQPQYLQDLTFVQPCHNTRSSSMVTLARPPTRSSLKITNRSFRYAAPCLWNELPLIFESLVRYSLLHFHLSHIMAVNHLLHHLHYHHLHLLLLAQSFILNLRLGFSANHFLHRPFFSYRTDSTDCRTI